MAQQTNDSLLLLRVPRPTPDRRSPSPASATADADDRDAADPLSPFVHYYVRIEVQGISASEYAAAQSEGKKTMDGTGQVVSGHVGPFKLRSATKQILEVRPDVDSSFLFDDDDDDDDDTEEEDEGTSSCRIVQRTG